MLHTHFFVQNQYKELHNLIDGFQIQRWSRVCQGTWAHKVSRDTENGNNKWQNRLLMLNVSSGPTEISNTAMKFMTRCVNVKGPRWNSNQDTLSISTFEPLIKLGAKSVIVDDVRRKLQVFHISYHMYTHKFQNRRPLLALINLDDITPTIGRQFRCRLAGLQCWNQLATNWIHLLACQSKPKHTKWVQFNLITYQLQSLEKNYQINSLSFIFRAVPSSKSAKALQVILDYECLMSMIKSKLLDAINLEPWRVFSNSPRVSRLKAR